MRRYDIENREWVTFPPDAHCVACGTSDRLVLDHDRFARGKDGRIPTRILCAGCNGRKGNRSYVSFRDGYCWIPGMKTGERVYNVFRAGWRFGGR